MYSKRYTKALLGILAAAAIAVLLATFASAAPLLSKETRFRQTDGQTFLATSCGDERCHYFKTADGDILLQGSDGAWYYAELQLDGESAMLAPTAAKYLVNAKPESAVTEEIIRATPALWEDAQAGDGELLGGIAPWASSGGYPYLGEQPVLVLLVEFNDVAIKYEAEWPDHVFGLAQRSARDYYRSNTMGKIDLVPAQESYRGLGAENDGVVRVKLNQNHPNIAHHLNGTPWTRLREEMVIAAVRAAAEYVDFKRYDRNRDGIIGSDELHIVMPIAGYEHSYRPDETLAPSIWGHKSMILWNSWKLPTGLRFESYTAFGEVYAGWEWDLETDERVMEQHMATIGVIVHELGHDLGLPDFYNQADGTTLDGFSVMAEGCWGTTDGLPIGSVPVGFDPWCLEQLGIVIPQTVPEGQSYSGTLKSISTGEKMCSSSSLRAVAGRKSIF